MNRKKSSKTYIKRTAALLAAGLVLSSVSVRAQGERYGADHYGSPVNFAITMAGNVGEIRADHFHTGIDVKALQGVGSPIYAAADGYISRIGVSPSGYGNVLYIAHPNGETTVYGHLDSFEPRIAAWVRQQQYAKKSFRVDLYPSKEQFPVKKGERIASLGNSGSSGGPHLHFEIRDASGRARNIIAQGVYRVADRVPPEVRKALVFEVDTAAGNVPVHRLRHSVPLRRGADGVYMPEGDSVLPLARDGYVAYETIDFKDGKTNTMGLYSIRQRVDGQVNFYFALDRISFVTTRYINTFTSYAENRAAGRADVLRAYVSPNNALSVYRTVEDRGVVRVPAGNDLRQIETEFSDDAGNISRVRFYLRRDAERPATGRVTGEPVHWDRDFRYTDSLLTVFIPSKALYESAMVPLGADSVPGVVQVGSDRVPLQKAIDVVVAAPGLPRELRAKAVLATVNREGRPTGSAGGAWQSADKGFEGVKASVRRLGRYRVAVDTVPPVIRPAYAGGSTVPEGKTLSFTVTDNLSGVSSYSLSVDGKWELLSWDPKNRLMEYTPVREAGKTTKHDIVLTVTDTKNNKQTFKATYIW